MTVGRVIYLAMYDAYAEMSRATSADCIGAFDSREKALAALETAGVKHLDGYIEELVLNELTDINFTHYAE